ncbi:hypothetical protein GCM10010919_16820 [Alishewanella longhuensis]|uniref:MSHA biogenesis protein MshN n=1 Tax=Alishewanella longhuensis TaxID=1091037 RepID=A0ABQ3KXH7_9ALTE|nr:hypothetical protein [Alishewanella longhuensis]GHG67826.1 hypothetical protein GCM10010919_16820 [Alishewanella longhuensis]
MSVINKMLQDLQQREASPPLSNTVVQSTATMSESIPWQQPKRRRKFLALMMLAVVVAAAFWYWPILPPTAQQLTAQPLTAEQTAAEQTAAEQTATQQSTALQPTAQQVQNALVKVTEIATNDNAIIKPNAASVPDLSYQGQPVAPERPAILQSTNLAYGANGEAQAKLNDKAATVINVPLSEARPEAPSAQTVSEVVSQQESAMPESRLTIEQAPVSVLQQQYELAVSAASAQQWQQALAYLSAAEPIATFPAYFALKAAVLQQQAEWSAALELYQQLLQLEPTHAGWNLAAGISAQQLSANELAQRFYVIAWQHRTQLPAASQAYLQQQLSQMKL